VNINILTYSFYDVDEYQNIATEKNFEKYAIENNFNITIHVETMKFENARDSNQSFTSVVESSLKKSNKFDIYFYDNRYTYIYGPYLLNLKGILPKEYINMFNSRVLEEIGTYNDSLVGIVMFIINIH